MIISLIILVLFICIIYYYYPTEPITQTTESFDEPQQSEHSDQPKPKTQMEKNAQEFRKYYGEQQKEFPCFKKMSQLGYDNPYIYPYNYPLKPIENSGYYNYPQWTRYIESVKLDQTFPGYIL